MSIKIRVGDFKLREEERDIISDVLDSGRISEGEKVREFEKSFAGFVGTKHAIAVSSGTAALISGLEAVKNRFNIRTKAKVITTPVTYIATSNSIVLSGFEPIYVDIDRETYCITPDNIRTQLENVKDVTEYSMILPVHLMGYSCDMNKINKIAKDYGLLVFEDSAQAHGTIYNGKRTGSLSLISAFSFYIAHNIQAGELGAVTSNDYEIIKLIRRIKANGRSCDCPICVRSTGNCPQIKNYKKNDDFDPRFTHELIGYNFKTMEFQAALASVQLKKTDAIKEKRSKNVKYLNDELEQFSDVLQIPKYDKNVSYMAYPLMIKQPDLISRKKLRLELEKMGVETRPLFGCIPTQQPAYSHFKKIYTNKLPNAEVVGKNGFYIGCHQYLTEENLNFIVKCFKSVLKGIAR